MVKPVVQDKIERALSSIEDSETIRILYACESGSRAWGFESADSDYDVRFIYMHAPEWYLSIDDGRDVSEHVDGLLDLSGWDIRKALRLLRKSNPPLLEWLRSPVVYREELSVVPEIRKLASEFFSPKACLHHYLHMAEGNFREYLRGTEVKTKKYFYVLRPVLACLWIEENGSTPPMEFEHLVRAQTLDGQLAAEIDMLLRRKKSGDEMDVGPRIEVIDDFIDASLARLQNVATDLATCQVPDTGTLDALFRDSLKAVWPVDRPKITQP